MPMYTMKQLVSTSADKISQREFPKFTYVLLLFINVPDLKPDVLLGQGAWGIGNDVPETLKPHVR